MKLAIVVNEPPPYRIPVFNLVAQTPGISLRVIFCCRREPNRLWDLPAMDFDHQFLRERIATVKGRYIHNNPDVLPALARFAPDVVITNGFNPTHLYALAWARLRGRAHVPMTDGTLASEAVLGRLHRRIRGFTYAGAAAFIAASNGGLALYESYGVERARCFKSCLCIDNARFRPQGTDDKPFDFIFCARIEAGKNPGFALRVAQGAAARLGRPVRMLVAGSGSEEASMREQAKAMAPLVDVHFHGFARQHELPGLYRSAKLFLFPTQADVWGVVANEACAAGLPVLVSPHAGVAGELVREGENGHAGALDSARWASRAAMLLSDEARRWRYGLRSLELVQGYSFAQAARGITDAALHAHAERTQAGSVRRPDW